MPSLASTDLYDAGFTHNMANSRTTTMTLLKDSREKSRRLAALGMTMCVALSCMACASPHSGVFYGPPICSSLGFPYGGSENVFEYHEVIDLGEVSIDGMTGTCVGLGYWSVSARARSRRSVYCAIGIEFGTIRDGTFISATPVYWGTAHFLGPDWSTCKASGGPEPELRNCSDYIDAARLILRLSSIEIKGQGDGPQGDTLVRVR